MAKAQWLDKLIPAKGEAEVMARLKGAIGAKGASMRSSRPRRGRFLRPAVPTVRLPWAGYMTPTSYNVPAPPTFSIQRIASLKASDFSATTFLGVSPQRRVQGTTGSVSVINPSDVSMMVTCWFAMDPVDDDDTPFNVADVDIADPDFLNRRQTLWRRQFILGGSTSASPNIKTLPVKLRGGTLGTRSWLSFFMDLRSFGGDGSEDISFVHNLVSQVSS